MGSNECASDCNGLLVTSWFVLGDCLMALKPPGCKLGVTTFGHACLLATVRHCLRPGLACLASPAPDKHILDDRAMALHEVTVHGDHIDVSAEQSLPVKVDRQRLLQGDVCGEWEGRQRPDHSVTHAKGTKAKVATLIDRLDVLSLCKLRNGVCVFCQNASSMLSRPLQSPGVESTSVRPAPERRKVEAE